MKKDILSWALKLVGGEVTQVLADRRRNRISYKEKATTVTRKRDYK